MAPINVTNKFLADVTWLKQSLCNFSIDNNIDVWHASVNLSLPELDRFKTLLTPGEVARANRYYQLNDRNRFITGRGMLKNVLGKYLGQPPQLIELEPGKNKKPHIKDHRTNLQYNLSHSGDAVLLAISDAAVGADIEFINNKFRYHDVLDDNFSADEVKYIKDAESLARFFKIWTRKEAITKATAQGLDCDLKLLPGMDGVHKVQPGIIASGNDWLISSFRLNNEYMASVASSPFIKNISFFTFDGTDNRQFFG